MWNKESLLKSETITVKVCGGDVVIRKLKAGEVLKKGNDEDRAVEMVAASLIEPVLTVEDVKNMSIDAVNSLLAEIMTFNGMDKEAKQGN